MISSATRPLRPALACRADQLVVGDSVLGSTVTFLDKQDVLVTAELADGQYVVWMSDDRVCIATDR